MTESFAPVGIDEARERLEPAGEWPVGMDAASLPIEENACAVVLVAHAQDGAASLGMLRDEFRRSHAKAPRQPQDFVGADADRLVMTKARASVAAIGKRALARESKIDPGKSTPVRPDLARSGTDRDR
jgi:hypothetical protein